MFLNDENTNYECAVDRDEHGITNSAAGESVIALITCSTPGLRAATGFS